MQPNPSTSPLVIIVESNTLNTPFIIDGQAIGAL